VVCEEKVVGLVYRWFVEKLCDWFKGGLWIKLCDWFKGGLWRSCVIGLVVCEEVV
jgi:hypothetical protein